MGSHTLRSRRQKRYSFCENNYYLRLKYRYFLIPVKKKIGAGKPS